MTNGSRPPPPHVVIWSASTLKNNFGERVNSQDLFTAAGGRERSPAMYLRFPKGMIELTNSSCSMERRINNCNYSKLRVNDSINRGRGILSVYDDIDCDIASYFAQVSQTASNLYRLNQGEFNRTLRESNFHAYMREQTFNCACSFICSCWSQYRSRNVNRLWHFNSRTRNPSI